MNFKIFYNLDFWILKLILFIYAAETFFTRENIEMIILFDLSNILKDIFKQFLKSLL